MAQQRFSNVAKSKLAGSIVAADTSLSVTAGDGAKFPALSGSDFFYATLQTSTTREDIKVTARSGDVFTIERGKEDTSAQDWTAGADVRLHVTAGFMETVSAFLVNAALAAIAALTPAANKIPYFTSGSAAGLLTRDTDGTLAGNSDTNIATQKAVKTYVDTAVASGGVVSSVFGRTGAVVKNSGDYAVADVTGAAPLASPTFTGTPAAPTASAGTNSTQVATTAYADNAVAKQAEFIMLAISDETTALTTGTAKVTFRMPFACSMTALPRANVNTVSSSGTPTFDIKKNGTTIFSTTLTIDASEKTSVTAATPAVLTSSPTTFADDDEITIDISTAGTGTKGAKITLNVVRT